MLIFVWSLIWGHVGIGALLVAGAIAVAILFPTIRLHAIVAAVVLIFATGYIAKVSIDVNERCEERHRVATEKERKRQEELVKRIQEQQAELARVNALLEAANQGEINATPVNATACLDRAGAARVRRIR